MKKKTKHSTLFTLILFGSYLSSIEPTLADKTRYLKEDNAKVITQSYVTDKWNDSVIYSELNSTENSSLLQNQNYEYKTLKQDRFIISQSGRLLRNSAEWLIKNIPDFFRRSVDIDSGAGRISKSFIRKNVEIGNPRQTYGKIINELDDLSYKYNFDITQNQRELIAKYVAANENYSIAEASAAGITGIALVFNSGEYLFWEENSEY